MKKKELKKELKAGNYYWVKIKENSKFEPAKCSKNEKLFCFTNGSAMDVDKAFDFIPLIK